MWSSPTIHCLHTARETPPRWVRTSEQGTVDLEWVQVHPTGLVKPDDPDAKIKFLAAEALRGVGGLVFVALGNLVPDELSKRDHVTGEMRKNKPPFRLVLNRAASDEIARHCKHYIERGVMKFNESGAALAEGMRVPVSKMRVRLKPFARLLGKRSKIQTEGRTPRIRAVSHGMKSLLQDGLREEVRPQRHIGRRLRGTALTLLPLSLQ